MPYTVKVCKFSQESSSGASEENDSTLSAAIPYFEERLHEIHALSALSKLQHSAHIVRYFGGWVQNACLYIVVSIIRLNGLDGVLPHFFGSG